MKLISYLQHQHGIARRILTQYIKDREILLNGKVVDNFLATVKDTDQYIITVLGLSGVVQLSTMPQQSQLVLFYKPVGYTVSKSDPHNDTIFDILPIGWKSIYYPIGRLDKDSCGLLLLTDNPQLVNQLSHPRYEHSKLYHVLLKQPRNPHDTSKVLQGVQIYDEQSNKNITLSCDSLKPLPGGVAIELHEGKNRHIRKMLGQLGYDITELKRVSFCGLQLRDLQVGEYCIYQFRSLDQFLTKMAGQGVGNL